MISFTLQLHKQSEKNGRNISYKVSPLAHSEKQLHNTVNILVQRVEFTITI